MTYFFTLWRSNVYDYQTYFFSVASSSLSSPEPRAEGGAAGARAGADAAVITAATEQQAGWAQRCAAAARAVLAEARTRDGSGDGVWLAKGRREGVDVFVKKGKQGEAGYRGTCMIPAPPCVLAHMFSSNDASIRRRYIIESVLCWNPFFSLRSSLPLSIPPFFCPSSVLSCPLSLALLLAIALIFPSPRAPPPHLSRSPLSHTVRQWTNELLSYVMLLSILWFQPRSRL